MVKSPGQMGDFTKCLIVSSTFDCFSIYLLNSTEKNGLPLRPLLPGKITELTDRPLKINPAEVLWYGNCLL